MARGSAAYDFALFEQSRNQTTLQPELQVVETPAKKQALRLRKLKTVLLGMMIIGVLSAMIYNQAMLTEISHQISDEKARLSELQSENVRLQSQLERSISIKSLEQQAIGDLGMSKIDKSQISYINMSGGDQVFCAAALQQDQNLWQRFSGWCSSLLHNER